MPEVLICVVVLVCRDITAKQYLEHWPDIRKVPGLMFNEAWAVAVVPEQETLVTPPQFTYSCEWGT